MKIIQISVVDYRIWALCDDGSLWWSNIAGRALDTDWYQYAPIPQAQPIQPTPEPSHGV